MKKLIIIAVLFILLYGNLIFIAKDSPSDEQIASFDLTVDLSSLAELYSLAYDNFFGNHHAYGDPERPALTKLLQYENIGFYCFYGAGNIELCMIPLTASARKLPEAESVEIVKMQDLLQYIK